MQGRDDRFDRRQYHTNWAISRVHVTGGHQASRWFEQIKGVPCAPGSTPLFRPEGGDYLALRAAANQRACVASQAWMEPLHTKKVGAFSRAGIDKSTTCVHFKNTQKDDSRTSNQSEVGWYCLAFAWFFLLRCLSSQLQAKYPLRSNYLLFKFF